ncbi:hypothetical protein ACFL1U_00590 [Patescibacteria group bacterium]
MNTKKLNEKNIIVTVLRWIARIWTVASLLFLAVMLVGEVWNAISVGVATWPTVSEWIGMLFFPIGIIVGLIFVWKKEFLGSIITLGSFVIFYVYMFILRGMLPRGPYFALVALPGLLFLIIWLLKRDWKPAKK